ncbi:MAG: cysteine desulfurase, partial [Lachnospiraceae bacterium]|nr:cysteine desulfurase [Lachnospiraceae bacterium]
GKRHIVSQKTEHHAVLNTLAKLEKRGFEITLLDVDGEGKISADRVENAIREDTALVTVMTANNETGVLMPVKEIAEVCHENGVLFHTDAVQAVGHISVDVNDIDCDMLSLSAHKFHGAKGVGALYCKRGITPYTLIEGGGQERGVRSGTENVGGICAMAAALKEAVDSLDENIGRVLDMRNALEKGLSFIPFCRINGSADRLPSIVNIGFEGIESESLLLMLDNEGICCSAGSACNSGSLDPSYVLKAMGQTDEAAMSAVRFSLSEYNTLDEIEYIVQKTMEIVKYLRSVSPVWERLHGH